MKPQSSGIIGLKWPDEPGEYGLQYAILPSFKPQGKNLIEYAQKKGQKTTRPTNNGAEVGVECYILRHSDGGVFVYKNKSTDYELIEDLILELRNAIVETTDGCPVEQRGTVVKVECKPGETKMINIVRDSSIGKCKVGAQFSFCVRQM